MVRLSHRAAGVVLGGVWQRWGRACVATAVGYGPTAIAPGGPVPVMKL
jgi:hypothetical protein